MAFPLASSSVDYLFKAGLIPNPNESNDICFMSAPRYVVIAGPPPSLLRRFACKSAVGGEPAIILLSEIVAKREGSNLLNKGCLVADTRGRLICHHRLGCLKCGVLDSCLQPRPFSLTNLACNLPLDLFYSHISVLLPSSTW
jgi:hypothetical protein